MREREVEVKFSVRRPEILERTAGWRALGRFRRVKSSRERQINRYWDTADRRLRRARAALKLRQVGRRAEMTFKRELRYRSGISERIEVTVPVPAALARIRRLLKQEPFIEPVRLARKIAGQRTLQVVVCLRTDRRTRRFAAGAAKVELALDRVEVLRGGRVVGMFREIELESLSAKEVEFREAVRELRRQLGPSVRISRAPKVATGLRLLEWGAAKSS